MNEHDDKVILAGAGGSGGPGGVTSRGFSFRTGRRDQDRILRAARGLVS